MRIPMPERIKLITGITLFAHFDQSNFILTRAANPTITAIGAVKNPIQIINPKVILKSPKKPETIERNKDVIGTKTFSLFTYGVGLECPCANGEEP